MQHSGGRQPVVVVAAVAVAFHGAGTFAVSVLATFGYWEGFVFVVDAVHTAAAHILVVVVVVVVVVVAAVCWLA